MILQRPTSEELQSEYMKLLPAGDLVGIYEAQSEELIDIVANLSEEQSAHRYAEGKWSIKEVVGHLIDTERVMAYRLLCAARNDSSLMPAFDEGAYVDEANFNARPMPELVSEWTLTRQASLALIQSLSPASLRNVGMFHNRRNTALAIACLIPAHAYHHIQILHQCYGL